MKRRETHDTTGSRILVRFFGGWDFTAEDAPSHNQAKLGYGKAVLIDSKTSATQESIYDVV